ncbi:unnamed protein product [Protopolystoma xenopodis]|uniref:Uncharacterized protein n=1 Tax=Protopolystoma xenopodis TaxID=117903 RepID=A0A3S5AA02_9PLAT|nr:unnamed protein product [Protopolystoma xenopodis]
MRIRKVNNCRLLGHSVGQIEQQETALKDQGSSRRLSADDTPANAHTTKSVIPASHLSPRLKISLIHRGLPSGRLKWTGVSAMASGFRLPALSAELVMHSSQRPLKSPFRFRLFAQPLTGCLADWQSCLFFDQIRVCLCLEPATFYSNQYCGFFSSPSLPGCFAVSLPLALSVSVLLLHRLRAQAYIHRCAYALQLEVIAHSGERVKLANEKRARINFARSYPPICHVFSITLCLHVPLSVCLSGSVWLSVCMYASRLTPTNAQKRGCPSRSPDSCQQEFRITATNTIVSSVSSRLPSLQASDFASALVKFTLDSRQPPYIHTYIYIHILHASWGSSASRTALPFRPRGSVASADCQSRRSSLLLSVLLEGIAIFGAQPAPSHDDLVSGLVSSTGGRLHQVRLSVLCMHACGRRVRLVWKSAQSRLARPTPTDE